MLKAFSHYSAATEIQECTTEDDGDILMMMSRVATVKNDDQRWGWAVVKNDDQRRGWAAAEQIEEIGDADVIDEMMWQWALIVKAGLSCFWG